MYRIRLIHWNSDEAKQAARMLRSGGYDVEWSEFDRTTLRALSENPPAAIVIDLSRLPSQGRDIAVGLRRRKATRYLPLVFVAGDPMKVNRVREILPDATYTQWDGIDMVLRDAIDHAPDEPAVPDSVFAAYAGTPLPKKLGIKANSKVALVEAPQGFEDTLGELPHGAALYRDSISQPDITLWFNISREELEQGIGSIGQLAANGRLWVIWPKKTSGVSSDLTQTIVREVGLASGLVDFKVCAIDATWSGLCFTRRKTER